MSSLDFPTLLNVNKDQTSKKARWRVILKQLVREYNKNTSGHCQSNVVRDNIANFCWFTKYRQNGTVRKLGYFTSIIPRTPSRAHGFSTCNSSKLGSRTKHFHRTRLKKSFHDVCVEVSDFKMFIAKLPWFTSHWNPIHEQLFSKNMKGIHMW